MPIFGKTQAQYQDELFRSLTDNFNKMNAVLEKIGSQSRFSYFKSGYKVNGKNAAIYDIDINMASARAQDADEGAQDAERMASIHLEKNVVVFDSLKHYQGARPLGPVFKIKGLNKALEHLNQNLINFALPEDEKLRYHGWMRINEDPKHQNQVFFEQSYVPTS